MRSRYTIALALVGLVFACAPAADAARFEVTNLGILPGGTASEATAVGDNGHVVGNSAGFAFLWRPSGGMEKINLLTPDLSYAGPDVNSTDVVAVTGPHTDEDAFGFLWHANRWAGGLATNLGAVGEATCSEGCDVDPNNQSFANGINENMVVVGTSTIDGSAGPGVMAATYWPLAGDPIRLGGSSGGSAREIANNGRIAGSHGPRAALWEDVDDPPVDLGLLPGSTGSLSDALDLNETGTVVGNSEIAPGVVRAFVWTPGAGMQPIASPNTLSGFSTANAIGPDGTIVGSSFNGSQTRAIIREPGTPIVDLNTLIPEGTGWNLRSARDINDDGQIVGVGEIGGTTRAFLLTPIDPLQVELETITVGDNDVFDLKMTVEHLGGSGTTKISSITYPPAPGLALRNVPVLGGPAPVLTRIFGPTGTFPTALDPGQKSEHVFAYAIDAPGNGLLQTRVRGTDQEGNQFDTSAALLIEAELKSPDMQELQGMIAGMLLKLADDAYRKRDALLKELAGIIKKRLKGTPAKMRNPTRREVALAAAVGMPAASLAAFPNKTGGKANRVAVFNSFYGALSDEMDKVGAEALDRTFKVPFSYWNEWLSSPGENRARMAMEMSATLSEGTHAVGGVLGNAAGFYTSPSEWKAAWNDLPEMYDESSAVLKKVDVALSNAILNWDDTMKRDPIEGARQFGKLLGRIEGEVAVGWLEEFTGGKVVQGLKVFNESRVAAGVVTESAEVVTDATRLTGAGAKALDDAPMLGNLSQKQVDRFQDIAKRGGEKFGVDMEIQARPINKFAAGVKGGIGKVEAIPTKNLTPDDIILGAPEKWIGQTTYYRPKLPSNFKGLDAAEQARLKQRWKEKYEEWQQFQGVLDDSTGKTAKVLKALKGETEIKLGKNGKLVMELEKTVDKSGAVLISYKKLVVNGKPAFTGKPRPIISDVDFNAVIDASTGRHLPAGIRGQAELWVMREFAKAAEEGIFPFGYHGWTHSGFDISAKGFKDILRYQIMYADEAGAQALAKKFAPLFGTTPAKLLDGYTRGKLLVKITATGAVLGPGAGL
ncbi:MAG: hypothetical protein QG596_911 [Actinomycetota bacterium]|nr:hypothetical protein [Actinomycetota bacterium]